ncbi:unnamed protein product [Brassica oleracea]
MSSCNGFSSLIYIEFLDDNELEAGDTDTGRGNSSCETPSNKVGRHSYTSHGYVQTCYLRLKSDFYSFDVVIYAKLLRGTSEPLNWVK